MTRRRDASLSLLALVLLLTACGDEADRTDQGPDEAAGPTERVVYFPIGSYEFGTGGRSWKCDRQTGEAWIGNAEVSLILEDGTAVEGAKTSWTPVEGGVVASGPFEFSAHPVGAIGGGQSGPPRPDRHTLLQRRELASGREWTCVASELRWVEKR